jgi:hypothetical protein
LKGTFSPFTPWVGCANQTLRRSKKDCFRFFRGRGGNRMTLSFCGAIRYTANAKSSAFYLPDVLMLWRLYNSRSLNSAKKLPNNSPANNGWQPVFAASNNSMHRCARSHDHGLKGWIHVALSHKIFSSLLSFPGFSAILPIPHPRLKWFQYIFLSDSYQGIENKAYEEPFQPRLGTISY